jgi:transposase-like protein
VVYTTNAPESVLARIRKIIKTRGHFPTDEAATKLIWLALRDITAGLVESRPSLARGNEPIRDPV